MKVARERQSDMHRDEYVMCAYYVHGCSEMRRHDIDDASELSR